MKEIFESVVEAYKGRFRNKFIGTFFLFYLTINWKKMLAILYVSEFTYNELVAIISTGSGEFYWNVGLSIFLSMLYLMTTPWLSYFVSKVQNEAIYRYKVNQLAEESRVLTEKKNIELKRNSILRIVEENLNIKISNSEKESRFDDQEKLAKMRNILPERELRKILKEGANGNIKNKHVLSEFIIESELTDSRFGDQNLNEAIDKFVSQLRPVSEFFETMARVSASSPIAESMKKKINDSYSEVLNSYTRLFSE